MVDLGRDDRRWPPAASAPLTTEITIYGWSTFDLPDTNANVEAFGRPSRFGCGEQDVGYPQLRMVGLVECGTHAVFDAATAALRT
ncbi:hypothetical protein [Streptomyces hokutonensis]|uniref:hypothetical protein n=1 Tax=Streptomyces hokutonensis TaxID=1306990 RepID=UPI0036A3D56B